MNHNPGRVIKDLSISTRIYLGLIAFMITAKVIFLLFPTTFPGADQEGAFYWTTILIIAVMGSIGLFLSRRTGFPDIWGRESFK
jgi:hypothetical protein